MSHAGCETRRKLPISIQNFREMREEVYFYADKHRIYGEPVLLISVEFIGETLNIKAFESAVS